MGKKSKIDSKDSVKDDNSKVLGVKKKIQKKKSNKNKSSNNVKNDDEINPKKVIFDNEEQTSSAKDTTQLNKSSAVKVNKKSRIKDKINTNTKIIFGDDDDEPQDVSVINNVASNKKTLIPNCEEEPKDEDIDKFCDEIDEEDNKQYENWIQLLEAKLRSNKKKV